VSQLEFDTFYEAGQVASVVPKDRNLLVIIDWRGRCALMGLLTFIARWKLG